MRTGASEQQLERLGIIKFPGHTRSTAISVFRSLYETRAFFNARRYVNSEFSTAILSDRWVCTGWPKK